LEKQLEELEVKRRKLVAVSVETELEATRTLFQTTRSVPKEELNQKETEYQVALTEHEIALETVRKRLITAPFSGIITEFYLQIGEPCEAQQPVLRLVDTRQCYFVCNVEPETVAALNVGDIVPLSIQTGSEPVRVTGTVVFISPVVDPGSGLLRVRLLFDNPDGRVRPGVAGTLLLQEASHAN
jgi:RND family efflux transporter MFP subunit